MINQHAEVKDFEDHKNPLGTDQCQRSASIHHQEHRHGLISANVLHVFLGGYLARAEPAHTNIQILQFKKWNLDFPPFPAALQ